MTKITACIFTLYIVEEYGEVFFLLHKEKHKTLELKDAVSYKKKVLLYLLCVDCECSWVQRSSVLECWSEYLIAGMDAIYTLQTARISQSREGCRKMWIPQSLPQFPLLFKKTPRWGVQVLMTSLCLIIDSEILLSVQLFKTAKHMKRIFTLRFF